jgi:hypothetical protein
MKEIKVFVSPTCGPCQLFKPQLRQAALDLNIEYSEYDVSTEDGLAIAQQYNIQSSGQAIYFEDNIEKKRWTTPCPSSKIKSDIQSC